MGNYRHVKQADCIQVKSYRKDYKSPPRPRNAKDAGSISCRACPPHPKVRNNPSQKVTPPYWTKVQFTSLPLSDILALDDQDQTKDLHS